MSIVQVRRILDLGKSDLFILAGIVFLPLLILFVYLKGGFQCDWYNHLWLAAYFGAYAKTHIEFPSVIHTQEIIGLVFPVFYGPILYRILGFLSSFTGPHLAFRLLLFLSLFTQGLLIFKVIFQLCRSRAYAWFVTLLVSWAVYPLTNLYERNALPEFFAGIWLTSALCALFLIFINASDHTKIRGALLLTLFCALIGGTHTITAVFGFPLLALIALSLLFLFSKYRLRHTLLLSGVLMMTLLSMAPYLYALSTFQRYLNISSSLSQFGYITGLDSWWVRLLPIPLNYQWAYKGISGVGQLDTQINMPLLVLCLLSFYKLRKLTQNGLKAPFLRASILSFTAFLILFLLSVKIGSRNVPPLAALLMRLQFLYRLISFQNLLILLTVFFLFENATRFSNHFKTSISPILMAFLVVLSATGVFLKQLQAAGYLMDWKAHQYPTYQTKVTHDLLHLPPSFYGVHDYTLTQFGKYARVPVGTSARHVKFQVEDRNHFGKPISELIDTEAPSWVSTNIHAFPWNHIRLDGAIVPETEIRFEGPYLALHIPQSGRHHLEYHWEPAPLWTYLDRAASATIICIFLLNFIMILGFYILPQGNKPKKQRWNPVSAIS